MMSMTATTEPKASQERARPMSHFGRVGSSCCDVGVAGTGVVVGLKMTFVKASVVDMAMVLNVMVAKSMCLDNSLVDRSHWGA